MMSVGKPDLLNEIITDVKYVFRVDELSQMLDMLGLFKFGRKAQLQQRLISFLETCTDTSQITKVKSFCQKLKDEMISKQLANSNAAAALMYRAGSQQQQDQQQSQSQSQIQQPRQLQPQPQRPQMLKIALPAVTIGSATTPAPTMTTHTTIIRAPVATPPAARAPYQVLTNHVGATGVNNLRSPTAYPLLASAMKTPQIPILLSGGAKMFMPLHQPQLRITRTPFYGESSNLRPITLLVPNENLYSYNREFYTNICTFSLPTDKVAAIMSTRYQEGARIAFKRQVLVRFAAFNPKCINSDMHYPEALPAHLNMYVNGRQIKLPEVLPSNRKEKEGRRHPQPIEITAALHLNAQTNEMRIHWWQPPDLAHFYYMTIDVEQRLTVDELMSAFIGKAAIQFKPPQFTRSLIKSKFVSTDNEVLMVDELPASLLCPLSKCRMDVPIRSEACPHVQCFDAKFLLMMNERRATWRCPVCDVPIVFGKLFRDDYFIEILNSMKATPDVTELKLRADGSWISLDPDLTPADHQQDDSGEVMAMVKEEATTKGGRMPMEDGGVLCTQQEGSVNGEVLRLASDDEGDNSSLDGHGPEQGTRQSAAIDLTLADSDSSTDEPPRQPMSRRIKITGQKKRQPIPTATSTEPPAKKRAVELTFDREVVISVSRVSEDSTLDTTRRRTGPRSKHVPIKPKLAVDPVLSPVDLSEPLRRSQRVQDQLASGRRVPMPVYDVTSGESSNEDMDWDEEQEDDEHDSDWVIHRRRVRNAGPRPMTDFHYQGENGNGLAVPAQSTEETLPPPLPQPASSLPVRPILPRLVISIGPGNRTSIHSIPPANTGDQVVASTTIRPVDSGVFVASPTPSATVDDTLSSQTETTSTSGLASTSDLVPPTLTGTTAGSEQPSAAYMTVFPTDEAPSASSNNNNNDNNDNYVTVFPSDDTGGEFQEESAGYENQDTPVSHEQLPVPDDQLERADPSSDPPAPELAQESPEQQGLNDVGHNGPALTETEVAAAEDLHNLSSKDDVS